MRARELYARAQIHRMCHVSQSAKTRAKTLCVHGLFLSFSGRGAHAPLIEATLTPRSYFGTRALWWRGRDSSTRTVQALPRQSAARVTEGEMHRHVFTRASPSTALPHGATRFHVSSEVVQHRNESFVCSHVAACAKAFAEARWTIWLPQSKVAHAVDARPSRVVKHAVRGVHLHHMRQHFE